MWKKKVAPLRMTHRSPVVEEACRDIELGMQPARGAKSPDYLKARAEAAEWMEQERRGFPEMQKQFPVLETSEGVKAPEPPPPKKRRTKVESPVVSTPVKEVEEVEEIEAMEEDPYAVTPLRTHAGVVAEPPDLPGLTAAMSKISHVLECRITPPTWEAKEIADQDAWKKFLRDYLRYLAANGTCHPKAQVDAELMQALTWILPEDERWDELTPFQWLQRMDQFLTQRNNWAVGMEKLELTTMPGSTPDWQQFVRDIEAVVQVSTAHVSEKKKAIYKAVEKALFVEEAQEIERETREPSIGILRTIRVTAAVLSRTAKYTRAAYLRMQQSDSKARTSGEKRSHQELERGTSTMAAFIQTKRGGQAASRGLRCTICRQRSHLASVCPNKQFVQGGGNPTTSSQKGTQGTAAKAGFKKNGGGKQPNDGPRTSVMNALGHGVNCWVRLRVGRTSTTGKIPALADSGSPHYSFISASVARQLGLEMEKLKNPVAICAGNGTVTNVDMKVEVRMQLPYGRLRRVRLLVLEGCPVAVVIGHDILPTMEAMAKQVRMAKWDRTRFMELEQVADPKSSPYCVLDADSQWEEEGVTEEEGELIEIPREFSNQAEYLVLPGIEQASPIYKLCAKYAKVFRSKAAATPAEIKPMSIETVAGVQWPASMRQRVRQIPEAYRAEVEKLLEEMLAQDVIEKVASADKYSQLIVVRKKDGSLRLCIDFRGLNSVTVRNRHPLPLIRELAQRLRGQKLFGVLDLSQGYWQAPLAEESRELTVFATTSGMYQFKRVAFGLCNAPAYFQHALRTEILGHLQDSCLVYIDDILVFGKTEDEFLANLEKVLEALQSRGIAVKPAKCKLGVQSIEYVGLQISGETVDMTEERKMAIQKIARPQTVTQMRSFLGVLNYFRSHIDGYTELTADLYAMLEGREKKSKNEPLVWSDELDAIFEEAKRRASEAETLFHVEEGLETIVRTDASDYAVGGVIVQIDKEGRERPVLFLSKKLSQSQRNYSTSDKEMLGVFYCIRSAHQILAGRRFVVYSDHRPLESTRPSVSPRIERMKLALAEYDFEIRYLKGTENTAADLMSRILVLGRRAGPGVDMAEVEPRKLTEEEKRSQIIGNHHNGFTGHLGRDATVQEIRGAGHDWPGIQDDVSKFIAECLVCQKGRPARGLRHGKMFLEARGPGQEWGIDAVDLEASGGYKYILVVLCHFSRFVHLAPMRSLTSKECTEVLEKLFLTFGRPDRIRTDNAKNFKSAMVNELLIRYDCDAVDIPPYDSRSNAMVERAIQEVRRHVFSVRADAGLTWPQAVARTQFIMNRRIHSATGYAPADILFGRIGSLGYGEMERNVRHADGDGEGWFLAEYDREIARAVRDQSELQAEVVNQQQARAAGRTSKRKETELNIGDRVWVKIRLPGKHSKREQWSGPETVKARQGDLVVVTGRERDASVAISKLRKIRRDARFEGEDEGEGEQGGKIAQVLDHNPYRAGLDISQYEFKVRYAGDPDVHWIPGAQCHQHVQCQRYILDIEDLQHLALELEQ